MNNWARNRPFALTVACFLAAGATTATCWSQANAQSEPSSASYASAAMLNPESDLRNIWQNAVGEGFRSTTQSIALSSGATYGFAVFGGREAHHLALTGVTYGQMLGEVCGECWYRGNWELRLELFTGTQFSPTTEWLVGLTPHLSYNFATGTPWVPFLDAGAGVTATGIGPPDLSGSFEFNLQPCVGVQRFIKDHVAITVEARYMHWSCARLSDPNLGLNGVTGMLGITRLF